MIHYIIDIDAIPMLNPQVSLPLDFPDLLLEASKAGSPRSSSRSSRSRAGCFPVDERGESGRHWKSDLTVGILQPYVPGSRY